VDAIAVVEDEVRELVRRRGIDPAEQPSVVRRLVDEVIAHYDERSISGVLPPLPDTRSAARAVFDAVAGFGPLQPYLDDPLVEEIWINEPTKVFIARAGVHELTTTVLSEDQVRDLVEKMLKSSGRRVDLSAPFVDAMLPDAPPTDRWSAWPTRTARNGSACSSPKDTLSCAPACAATSPARSRSKRPSPLSTLTPPPPAATDWSQIVAASTTSSTPCPNAVIALNRAVAICEMRGAAAGLDALDSLDVTLLEDHQPYHAARANLLTRAGRTDATVAAYDRAIELTANPTERRFLERARKAVADRMETRAADEDSTSRRSAGSSSD
jgi:hypothetical protein